MTHFTFIWLHVHSWNVKRLHISWNTTKQCMNACIYWDKKSKLTFSECDFLQLVPADSYYIHWQISSYPHSLSHQYVSPCSLSTDFPGLSIATYEQQPRDPELYSHQPSSDPCRYNPECWTDYCQEFHWDELKSGPFLQTLQQTWHGNKHWRRLESHGDTEIHGHLHGELYHKVLDAHTSHECLQIHSEPICA